MAQPAIADSAGAQMTPSPASTVPVSVETFIRAETDMYFSTAIRQAGGVGVFYHHREPMPIDRQTVIRANRDTLYSAAAFDLDAAPVAVTLPEAGSRFMSLFVVSQDHYVPTVAYGAGTYHVNREQIGTRYVLVGVRMLVDLTDPQDVARANQLQDAIAVAQDRPGRFDGPNWDRASQKRVREALLVLGSTLQDMKHMFGTRDQVDPIRHLIGSAMDWGGNPDTEAIYLNVTPDQNDGTVVYRLTVGEVPVDAFWSISVYNSEGYFEPNDMAANSLNNITAAKSADGSIHVRFGGCDGTTQANCLPITPGWNYMVRLYRPRPEILDGTWTFPVAQPVQGTGS